MRKETRALLDDLINSGTEGWVTVDWGEEDVIDMIKEALKRLGFRIKTQKEIEDIAKEYEEEAINWAKGEGLKINYRIPVSIFL